MSGEIVFGHPNSYSFLFQAAAEAREASRRYWAQGGPADRKYPFHDDFKGPGELGPEDPGLAVLRRRRRVKA